jgi:class 3 adenylate cyclase/tetratricopeptide (TPR) repeat protein
MIACPRCGHPNTDGARFCSNCALEIGTPAEHAETRKTVTVMFIDAAGSTGLGERVDPEAMRRVMSRYFDEFRQIVERHGGIVEKYIGDALVAVFGVPTVHEDDALRAVRAAAEIRHRVADLSAELELERGLSIEWRTGINTGEVVAGDATRGERFVSGDAVNVAARLEQAAAPTEILLGSETLRLVRDQVTAELVSGLELKGKSDPQTAHRLIAISDSVAPARRLDSPMIGRERQQRLLRDAYEDAVEDRACHLFTVLGAAGVGKSRLISEFVETLGAGATVLYGRCLSYGDGITYWPVAEAIREAAALDDADDDQTIRRKLAELLGDERDRTLVVERLVGVLGRSAAAGIPEETTWAVRTLFESLARRAPLVLVMDDVHWAEHALLDLIEHLADWTSDAPLLLICLARLDLLEARPGWGGGKKYATTLTLEPLNEGESRQLVSNLLGAVDLGTTLEGKVTSAAEGNPLFVEEMLGMLIDHGYLVADNGGWRTVGDLSDMALPPTIQALLAARLDRLTRPERAVIERGAIEGKVFHRGAVAELAPEDVRESVPDQLRSLSRKELVRPDRSDFEGDEAFRFRHLLIRDAAYGSMPKEARAELHARFAGWLERVAGEQGVEYDEIVGYHLEQAYRYRREVGRTDVESTELAERAASYLGRSGRRALDRGDIHGARKLLTAAVELAPDVEPDRARLIANLGEAMVWIGALREADAMLAEEAERYAHSDNEISFALVQSVRLSTLTISASWSIDATIAECERLMEPLQRYGDQQAIARAVWEMARHHFFAGRARLAGEMLKDEIERFPPGQSPVNLQAMLLASNYWGPTTVAEATAQLDIVRERSGSRAVEAVSMRIRGGLLGLIGEFDRARALITESAAIESELGRTIMSLNTRGMFLGPLLIDAGEWATAEQNLTDVYDALFAHGDRAFSSTVAGHLAELYVRIGRWDDAERSANLCLSTSTPDDVESQAQGNSAMAQVLAARGRHDEAVAAAERAVEMARPTDYLIRRGLTHEVAGNVLLAAARHVEALESYAAAVELFDAKGATFPAGRVRARRAAMDG